MLEAQFERHGVDKSILIPTQFCVADLFSFFITVSHGSAYTVVRATQQVNGNGNFGVSELCNP